MTILLDKARRDALGCAPACSPEWAKKEAQTMRGMGRIFQMKGSKNLWIAYNCRGKEYRESCGSPELKEAKKLLKHRLKEIGADSLGARAFVEPQQDHLTVGDLLDALEADFRLRGLKSLR